MNVVEADVQDHVGNRETFPGGAGVMEVGMPNNTSHVLVVSSGGLLGWQSGCGFTWPLYTPTKCKIMGRRTQGFGGIDLMLEAT